VKFPGNPIIETENCYFQPVNRNKYQDLTDQGLLDRFNDSLNNEWLGILFERYTLLLLGVCMKYLKNEEWAKDSVQQIFLKAITELHKYKVTYFKSWIYMVAKNHCLMQLRDKRGRNTTEIKENFIATEEVTDQQEMLQDEKTYDILSEGLNELNPEQQQCVTLFYLQNKSYLKVSEETGLSLMQVKSHIQNGKRNLRIFIEKKRDAR